MTPATQLSITPIASVNVTRFPRCFVLFVRSAVSYGEVGYDSWFLYRSSYN